MIEALETTAIFMLIVLGMHWLWQRRQRERLKTPTGQQWQEYRSRLPDWVRKTEGALQCVLLMPLYLLLFVTLITVHDTLHRETASLPSMVLMALASLFTVLDPAILLANLVSYAVGPLRRANLRGFEGLELASFRSANIGLAKRAMALIPSALAAGYLGVFEPWQSR